jgi:hypothetical protein
MNLERYVRLILSTFFDELIDEEKSCGNVMQDNKTAHTTKDSIKELDKVLGKRVISRGLCPP